jgi:acyl-CoA dehydrogenase
MVAEALDRAHRAGRRRQRARPAAERSLAPHPVAKAYATDIGIEVASSASRSTAAWATSRRPAPPSTARRPHRAIYEGTNGIQAIDLVTRKLPLGDGAVVRDAIARMRETVSELGRRNAPSFGHSAVRLRDAVDSLERATAWMLEALSSGRAAEALAGATAYLKLFGLAQGGAALARKALAAQASLDETAGDRGHAARVVTARFFAEHLAAEAPSLERAITEGAGSVEDGAVVFAA